MKFYKKAIAVLTAAVIGTGSLFVQSMAAQNDSTEAKVSVYDDAVPSKDKDGYYQIYNAEQLYWLSNQFNNEFEIDMKVKIMQDIYANEGVVDGKDKTKRVWVPLGVDRGTGAETDNLNFIGEIDGQGHKISGLYCTGTRLAGLVGHNHGKIRNLGIENSYFFASTGSSSSAYSGSFAAFHNEGVIENCYSSAYVGSNYVSGGISGGIKGANAKIANCYSSGRTISTKTKLYAAAISYPFDGVAQVVNCYYLSGSDDKGTVKSTDQFASGEVAYLLNNGGGTFYQNLDNGKEKDAFPVLDSTHGKVLYKNGVYTNGSKETTVETTTETTTIQTTTQTTTQPTTQKPQEGFIYGGANADSKLSASDAAMILQKVLDDRVVMPIQNKTNDYFKYVDVDADGTLTASDAAFVMQKVLDEKIVFEAEKKK